MLILLESLRELVLLERRYRLLDDTTEAPDCNTKAETLNVSMSTVSLKLSIKIPAFISIVKLSSVGATLSG